MLDQVTCVGYIRVSTERQADEVHTSLEDQTQAIEGLAEKLGVTAGCWFRDAGASGATAEGRPAFMEMLGWCEQNSRPMDSPGHVLVLNDSRFGRFVEPEEATFWRHHLYRLGWIVRFCEGDEVEGDFRSIVRAIGSVQATEYRRNLVANTRRGMKGAAEQGFWTREAPYGYRRQVVYPPGAGRVLEIGQLKAPNEKVKLAPHTEEARMVRWAFEVYAAGGASLGSLSGDLQKRVPRRRWSRQVVGAMLKNHAYRGAVVGGRRREGGSERYGCEGAHQAIVTDALWNAVQARLEANRHRGRGVRSHYLVSGILRCSHCGESYTGGGGGRSRSKNPQRSHRRFYRDNGGTSGVCPGRIGTVMRHLVDAALVDVIGSTITRPAVRRRIERAIGDAMSGTSGSVGDSEVAARVERARWEKKRDRLIDAVADGTLLPEETSAQLEEIRAALAQIEGQMQALRFSRSRTQSVRSERGRLLEIAMDFPEVAARLSGPALRELVAPWVGALTFDKVGRVLSVGIRPIPAVPSLVPYPLPARG